MSSKHKVSRFFVFGSVLTDYHNQSDDIVFVADFSDADIYNYADNHFDLKNALEDLLNREIDLLEEKAINNPYFRQSFAQVKRRTKFFP